MEKHEAEFARLNDLGPADMYDMDSVMQFIKEAWAPVLEIEEQGVAGTNEFGAKVWVNTEEMQQYYQYLEKQGLSYYGLIDPQKMKDYDSLNCLIAKQFGVSPDDVDVPECRAYRLKVVRPRASDISLMGVVMVAGILSAHSMHLAGDVTPSLKSYSPMDEWTDETITHYFEFWVHYGS